MRIQYKGGVWKNSEDEILKAAVMKYGMNQWARIASLLVRKSAKQCKARWFEWLDPSIKKTEWTREEEEKLLHLAKIMPTSWRTIAPMIGRTATQCLEHYQKLLDQAQHPTDGDGAGPSAAAAVANRLRPGEVDPTPETRPARPDPVDMDEDELEMLSEARARLANTKGKKAKRKAREKQLEAAKRLAQLQKRRELKAAGIELKPRRKNRKVTDYATEIPFERTPAPGFYDTREEDERVLNESRDNQIGKLIQKYKGKTAEETEDEAKKRDSQKRKELEKVNLPAALGLDERAAEPLSPPLKKARMSLPTPQISDYELEKMAKGSLHVDSAKSVPQGAGGGESIRLLGAEIEQTGDFGLHKPQGQSWASVRQQQVETIANIHSAQTPLRGGPNTPVPELGLNGKVTPMRTDLRTSNTLATPFSVTNDSSSATQKSQVRRAEKEKIKRLQETVKKRLRSLPEPENEYEIEVDEGLLNADDTAVNDRDDEIAEDAEDEELRKSANYSREIEAQQRRLLSSVAKKNLPIPRLKIDSNQDAADSLSFLVRKDIATHDALSEYNYSNQSQLETLKTLRKLSTEQDIAEEEWVKARELVRAEMEKDEAAGLALERNILEALNASA